MQYRLLVERLVWRQALHRLHPLSHPLAECELIPSPLRASRSQMEAHQQVATAPDSEGAGDWTPYYGISEGVGFPQRRFWLLGWMGCSCGGRKQGGTTGRDTFTSGQSSLKHAYVEHYGGLL